MRAEGQDITFEQWCEELDKLPNFYGTGPVTKSTGIECWESYYANGYSPEDAIAEDASYE